MTRYQVPREESSIILTDISEQGYSLIMDLFYIRYNVKSDENIKIICLPQWWPIWTLNPHEYVGDVMFVAHVALRTEVDAEALRTSPTDSSDLITVASIAPNAKMSDAFLYNKNKINQDRVKLITRVK